MANRFIHGVVVGALALGLAACGDDTPKVTFNDDRQSGRPTGAPTASATTEPSGTTVSPRTVKPKVVGTVATNLDAPWGLAFLPTGGALISERDTGEIKLIDAAGNDSTVATVPGVDHGGEGGLLGIAIGPDFADDPLLYAYRTTATGNEVVRMEYSETGLGKPEVLVDGIEKSNIHNGGRLVFGPDGMLYASTGDASDKPKAQDKTSLNGKILRMTPDGKPAPGNPDPASLVWSYGHRNVQGLAFDGDQLWASELGQNSFDELNKIEAGDNYGWPEVEGDEGGSEFTRPQRVWATEDASPSGIAIAGGSVWMCALRGERLWQIPINGEGTGQPVAWFEGDYGRLRTVALAPDGTLWLITNNTDGRGDEKSGDDRILRVSVS